MNNSPADTRRDGLSPEAARRLDDDGWVLLESLFSPDEVAAAREELQRIFPDKGSVYREPDPVQRAEQFVGIREFPVLDAPAMNALVVHERLDHLMTQLLGTRDVILYQAQAWAKYAGAADYDQELHRDFRNHTLCVPSQTTAYRQIETFIYLSDVDEEAGPTHLVSRGRTGHVPYSEEFLPRSAYGNLYEAEQTAAAPAGSVLVYGPDVLHRGTNLTGEASRFVLSVSYQRRGHAWMGYHCWPKTGSYPRTVAFIRSATSRQLELIGFPPAGDPYWTRDTIDGVRARYGTIDLTGFEASL